jgi:hypothetical protein
MVAVDLTPANRQRAMTIGLKMLGILNAATDLTQREALFIVTVIKQTVCEHMGIDDNALAALPPDHPTLKDTIPYEAYKSLCSKKMVN